MLGLGPLNNSCNRHHGFLLLHHFSFVKQSQPQEKRTHWETQNTTFSVSVIWKAAFLLPPNNCRLLIFYEERARLNENILCANKRSPRFLDYAHIHKQTHLHKKISRVSKRCASTFPFRRRCISCVICFIVINIMLISGRCVRELNSRSLAGVGVDEENASSLSAVCVTSGSGNRKRPDFYFHFHVWFTCSELRCRS